MTNKLKVEELRTELSKRGLSIKGTKATLVQRFELVLEEESKSTEGSVGKRRKRKAEAMVDGSTSKKIKPIEDLQDVSAQTNGTAELDQYLPDDIKTLYHVLDQDEWRVKTSEK